MGMIFFVLFALVLVFTYLSIRREWLAPGVTAGIGVFASIVVMILFSLAQQTLPIQAVIVGSLLGLLFSCSTLAIAWYFHRNELRARGQ